MCERLLEEKLVGLLSGEFFYDPNLFRVRLSYVDFNGKEVLENANNFDFKDE